MADSLPWKIHEIGRIFNDNNDIQLRHFNEKYKFYLLTSWRCYVFKCNPLDEESCEKTWILKEIYRLPSKGLDLLYVNHNVAVLTKDGIITLNNSDIDILEDITPNFEDPKLISQFVDYICKVPNILTATAAGEILIISNVVGTSLHATVLQSDQGKFTKCNSFVTVDSHFSTKSNSYLSTEHKPILKVIRPYHPQVSLELDSLYISKRLYCKISSSNIGDTPFLVIIGCSDGRLLYWIPYNKTQSCKDDENRGTYKILCNLGQPVIGVSALCFGPDSPEDKVIAVIGDGGKIILISLHGCAPSEHISSAFKKRKEDKLKFTECQIYGPVGGFSFTGNILLHYTADRGKVWISFFGKVDDFTVESFELPICGTAGICISSLEFSNNGMINAITSTKNGKLYNIRVDVEALNANNHCGQDLGSALKLLESHSGRTQYLQLKKLKVHEKLEELSTLLEVMNFLDLNKFITTSVKANQVLGHPDEIYFNISFSNKSVLYFRQYSWIFCVSITNSTTNVSSSHSSPLKRDLKPGTQYNIDLIFKLSLDKQIKFPLNMNIGLTFAGSEQEPTYTNVSTISYNLLDLAKIDHIDECGHDSFNKRLSNLTKLRPSYTCHKVKKDFIFDDRNYEMSIAIRKETIWQIIKEFPTINQDSSGNLCQPLLKFLLMNNSGLSSAIHTTSLDLQFQGKIINLSTTDNDFVECRVSSSSLSLLIAFITSCHEQLKPYSTNTEDDFQVSKNCLLMLKDLRKDVSSIMFEDVEMCHIFKMFCHVRNNISLNFPL